MLRETFISKDGKEITLRTIEQCDLAHVKESMEYINEILDEDDFLTINEKYTPKTERVWLKDALKEYENRTGLTIFAEHNGRFVGTLFIKSRKWRENHIATLGISVKKEYRNTGIGSRMILAAIALAKKELKTKPKIIELEVCETNEDVYCLYQKLGFRKVAELPDRIQRKGKIISKYLMYKYVES